MAISLDSQNGDIASLDVSALKECVDKDSSPTRDNAINTYWLSRYYQAVGDEEKMVRYKTLAANYDALMVNREIAALQELATYLFEHDELNRAYTYLVYAVNQANLYHNRYRMVSLSDVLPSVRDKYREDIEKRDRRLFVLVCVLAILSIVLIGSVAFIVIEFNKLKKTRNLLKEANSDLSKTVGDRDKAIEELEAANAKLNAVNRELQETNAQKLGLLAYALRLSPQYINSLESYRMALLKKYKAKKYDDLGILINDPELIKSHYQGFYGSFDSMVLSLFPDLIEDYNRVASPENQASAETVRKTKTLNTRLRIYALMRLGVSKSSDIATMLNVSIRTVYNNKPASSFSDSRETPSAPDGRAD